MNRSLRSVAQFCASSPFTENQMRWWIFNSATNGFASLGVIVRVGRRVYIDVDAFDRWLTAQNAQAMSA